MARPPRTPPRRPRRPDPLLNQAQLEADLKYTPEQAGLRTVLRDAQGALTNAVALEDATAQGIRAALKESAPVMKKIYSQATGNLRSTDRELEADFAKLSATADPFKAAAAREAGVAGRRLASSGAAALREIQDRGTQAEASKAYANRQHQAQYGSTLEKVNTQAGDLAKQRGTYTAASYGNLQESKRRRDVVIRGQNKTASTQIRGQDKSAETQRRGQRVAARSQREANARLEANDRRTAERDAYQRQQGLGPYKPPAGGSGGKPRHSQAARTKAIQDFNYATYRAGQLGPKPGQGRQVVALLVDPPDRKRGDRAVAGAKPVQDPLLAKAGSEKAIYGGVFEKTARELHRTYGIRVNVYRPPARGAGRKPRDPRLGNAPGLAAIGR